MGAEMNRFTLILRKNSQIIFTILLIFLSVNMRFDDHADAQSRAPLCGIPVFTVPHHPMGAQATQDQFGNPVIVLGSQLFAYGNDAVRFVLAHECAHHVNGHIYSLHTLRMMGPYALLQLNPSIEADADCWAARTLAGQGDWAAIRAGIAMMGASGPFRQPGYPSGNERAQVINSCSQ